MLHPPTHHRTSAAAQSAPDPELAAILHDVVGPDQAFRHRQHVNLAFLAVQRYGMPEAVDKVCAWIRQLAAYQQAPQKYHHTVSRAWVELVAHHIGADADRGTFDTFIQRHPALLDKRLLSRHYRSVTLAAERARGGWAEPDLVPFPWFADLRSRPGGGPDPRLR